MTNITALVALIDTHPQCEVHLLEGFNSGLLSVVNDIKASGTKQWIDIPVDEFLDIIGDAVITVEQLARIELFINTGNTGVIPTTKANVRKWLSDTFATQTTVAAALIAAGKVEVTHAQDAGVVPAGTKVSMQDVRKAVRRIARSYIIAGGYAVLEV